MKAHWQSEKDAIAAIRARKEELEAAKSEADRFEREGDLSRAAEIRYGRIPELERKVAEASARLDELQSDAEDAEGRGRRGGRGRGRVQVPPASRSPASWRARWPSSSGWRRCSTERVVGQEEAVSAVASAIRRSRAGLSDPNRPIGSFLFLGPTGVGKTELAKALAEFLFDDERAMVRIDMGEYQEKHTVARLIGAPPGYVGYDEGGQLTEAVRRRPYAVVLLDEIEKAHSDVFNVLLQVLDDGRLTDGQGRTVDFTNAVLIMTSNLPVDPIEFFKPEFVNRIDEIVRFRRLERSDMAAIVGIQLRHLAARLAARRLTLDVSPEAELWLAEQGYDPDFGARPLKRVIQKELGDRLAMALLEGQLRRGRHGQGRRGGRRARPRLNPVERLSGIEVDLERAAGPPVEAVSPVQEPVVDEVAPEGGVVGMDGREALVDLLLGVGLAGFEQVRQPVEDHQPLAVDGRDLDEPAVTDKNSEYPVGVGAPAGIGGGPARQAGRETRALPGSARGAARRNRRPGRRDQRRRGGSVPSPLGAGRGRRRQRPRRR